jgi:hypothetical protein
MATECDGFDPLIVFDWLDEHCSKRDDGRYIALGRKLLDDSHRDTFDRWRLAMDADPVGFLVPLGRLDEILLTYGIMLWEFTGWAEELYGWDGYLA